MLLFLKTFLAVSRTGSITRAAEDLDLTQPTVSSHVRALENALGKPLFQRHPRGVVPTAIGLDLVRSLGTSLDEAEAAFNGLRARSEELKGVVYLGGPAEFMGARFPPVLALLLDAGLDVRMQLGGRERLYQLFAAEEIDIGITASEPESRALDYVPVHTETLVAVAAPDIARLLADRPDDATRWLAYDETLPLIRSYLIDVFRLGSNDRAVAVVPSLTFLRDLAVAGAGATVLPDYLCQDVLDDGRLVRVFKGSVASTNTLYLVWRRAALRHPRIVFVRDLIQAELGRTS